MRKNDSVKMCGEEAEMGWASVSFDIVAARDGA